MTILVARALDPPRWPLAGSIPELTVSNDASHPDKRRHCGVVTCSPASRRPRPRPPRAAPKQSADSGTTGKSVTTGPIRDPFAVIARAPLLRFYVPFSTRQPRRALFPKAAGLRTCPASAFPHIDVAFRPRSDRRPRSAAVALAVFRSSGRDHMRRVARDRRTFGVGRSIVANVSRGSAHTRVC